MGVLIDTNRRPAVKIDVDTLLIQSAIDAAMAEYLHIITELGAGTVVYASSIGDHQFKDIDDTDDSDTFQITADDLGGGVVQKTTKPSGSIWEIAPSTVDYIAANTLNYIDIDLQNVTVTDGGNAVILRGIFLDMDSLTETDIGNSSIYGARIEMADMSEWSAGAGIQVLENTDDYVVEIINKDNNALSIYGVSQDAADAFEGRNWVVIKPSVETIDTEAHSVLLTIDTDNWIIDDGANTPEITAILLNLDDMTETEHDGTVLLGIDIEMPDDMVGYGTAYGIRVANATQSVYILNDGTDALNWVGAASGDLLDLTPTTNVDALDIILTNDTFVSASAIDIDIGDYTGAGNIIDITFTEASTITGDLNIIKIDANSLLTTNTGTNDLHAIDIDFSTVVDTDFATFYAIEIAMPTAYQGADPTSAIHATGNDMTIDILHEGDFGIELETDVQDLDNALLPIFITKDLNITVAHADGGTLTNSGNTVDVTIDTYSLDTTPATNPNNTSAVGLHVYQRHRQGNANDVGNIDEAISGAILDLDQILTINNTNAGTPTIITTAPFIDMDLDVTETAGAVEIGAVDWISLSVDGGTIASAVSVSMLVLESGVTLNHGSAEFYGFELNTTGMTDTLSQADSVGGLSIVDDGILDYGIKAVNASDTLKLMDTENDRGIYADMNTAASTAIETTSDVQDINNALLIASLSKDLAITSTHAGGVALANSGVAFNISVQTTSNDDSGVAAAAHNTTATALKVDVVHDFGDADDSGDFDETVSGIMIDLDQTLIIDNTAAGDPSIVTTMPFIDMDLAVTETAGAIEIGAVDFISLTLGGGTVASAVAPKGFHINSNITLDHASAEFYGVYIDTTGMTDSTSQADSVGALMINDDGIVDYGIKLVNAVDTLKIMDNENLRGIYIDMDTANTQGLYIDMDVGDAADSMQSIYSSRAMGGAIGADRQMIGYSVEHDVVGTHTGAPGVNNEIDMDTSAGVMRLNMSCTTSNTDASVDPDTFQSTALLIDVNALTDTNGNAQQDVTARALDINYSLTETLGTLELNSTDIARILVAGGIDDAPAATAFNMLNIDADTFTIDDDDITMSGLKVDFETITDTDFAALYGINVVMPAAYQGVDPTAAIRATGNSMTVELCQEGDYGIYIDTDLAASTGLFIDADMGVTANDVIALETTRDMIGALTATSFTNYANIMGQSMIHSSNDAIATNDEGILQLVLNHDIDYASTNADVFSATALNIAVTCDMDDVGADLDVSARAIDISYAMSRSSAGAHNLDAVDILRIDFDVAAGCAIGDGGVGNVNMILLDGDGVIPGATISNNMNISGMMIDWSAASMNDANASLFGLYIEMPVADHDTAATVEGIRILGDTPSAHNDVIGITISKDLVNTAAGAGITQTNNALNVSSVNTNAEAFVMDVSNTLVDFIVSNAAAAAGADTYAGIVLNIDYSAEVATAGTATSSATGLLVDYNLTEGGGSVLTLDDFNVVEIDYDTVGTPVVGDGDYNLLYINGTDAGVPVYGDVTFSGINIDISAIDVTDDTLILYGAKFTIPNTVGIAVERAAVNTTDGVHTAKLSDGSMGISALGIADNKYYKCEDFDEEAAAVTLALGLRGDEWVSAGLNDAAANVTYIQDQCGVLQVVTNGLDNDSHELTWLNTVVNTGSNPILEFRVLIDSIAANMTGFFVGITETNDIQSITDISAVSDDYFVVGMDSDLGTPADLRCWGEDDNGGQVLTQLTGETVAATTWLTIRMDFTNTEQPRVWINHTGGAISADDELAAALVTQTIQDNIYVMPVIFVQCLDGTPSARTLLIDYMKIWQSRS